MLENRTRAGRGALLALLGACGGAMAESPATPATAVTPPAPPALENFGRLPAMRQVRLSPNGKLVAMEEEQAGARKVTIFEVDGGKTRHTVAVDEANKIRSLVWADDETLLLNVSIKHSYYCNPNVLCATEWFRTLSVRIFIVVAATAARMNFSVPTETTVPVAASSEQISNCSTTSSCSTFSANPNVQCFSGNIITTNIRGGSGKSRRSYCSSSTTSITKKMNQPNHGSGIAKIMNQ